MIGAGPCGLGAVLYGCHGDHELVSVVDHPPPVRRAGGVAGVHDDQPVVAGEHLVGNVHFLGGDFVVAFVVLV